jgi:transcriptional regulator with XRE-family HTH domain
MVSLYEHACEIKKTTGWTQEQISAETGLHISTVSRIFRVPGYQGNETSNKLLKQLHKEVVKSPFPAYIEQLFELYNEWKGRFSKREFSTHISILEQLLLSHRSLGSHELIACRVSWLLGHIYYDRAFYLKEHEVMKMVESALTWYQTALKVLTYHEENSLTVQKYKIQQCLVSTKFNCYNPNHRADSEEIRHWLREMDYLQLVETVVTEDTWNWIAARNGLVAASILQNLEKCQFFWQTMQKVNKNFENLDFVPSKWLPSIRQDSDLVWFVKQVAKG